MSEVLDPMGAEGAAMSPEMVSRPVLLRQSREAAGLHIAALAAALKVPVKKLEALEAGRYEELPDMTFARALASSACRQLKIDPAPVLEQIPLGQAPHLGDSHQAINTPFRPQEEMASTSLKGWLVRPVVWGTVALLLGALVLLFLPSLQGMFPAADVPLANEGNETVVVPATPDSSEPGVTVTPLVLGGSAALGTPVPASDGVPVAAEAPAASKAIQVAALLSISATGESWVEVVNGSGSVVMQRVLKEGDVVDFSTAPPYSVVLGRADAAQITVRGKPFDVAPFARNNVARFEVK